MTSKIIDRRVETGLNITFKPFLVSTMPEFASVVLDQILTATIPLKHGKGGTLIADIALPECQILHTLELLDPTSGRSLFDAPYSLADFYSLEAEEHTVSDGRLTGRFSASAFLADRLLVDLTTENDTIIARGFAIRQKKTARIAHYTFDIPLSLMCRPDEKIITIIRIGGAVIHTPVTITARDIGWLGFVDLVQTGLISGWAIDLTGAGRRVALDLIVNNEVISQIIADDFRPDLQQTGISDGHSAFSFSLTAKPGFKGPSPARVVVSGTEMTLINGSFQATPPSSIRGCFDILHGMSAHGWAVDLDNPKKPVKVEAVCNGNIIGTAEAKLFRGDLLDAGYNNGLCAFKIDIGAQLLDLLGQDVLVRIAGTDQYLIGSPRVAQQNKHILRYLQPHRDVPPAVVPRLKRMMNYRAGPVRLSIVMPVYNTPQDWLIEALNSVRAQWCDNWELLCINDASSEPHVETILRAYAQQDPRIRILRTGNNVGIARATNFGLRAASGQYVTFMDHDDYLEPDAVYHLLKAAGETQADFIYSDEATTDENIASIAEVRGRPAFSHDYYLSHPYIVHMLCLKRELAHQLGGWDESMAISADVDFVLRIIEHARTIAHVPRVLYRWRTHSGSTGHSKKQQVMEATQKAIQAHLDRLKTGATVEEGVWFNQFRINWPKSQGRVLIVIPTKNKADLVKTAVESIERTTPPGVDYRIVVVDHESTEPESQKYFRALAKRHIVMPYQGPFNYSKINNEAVKKHGDDCEFVLFLNNDVEAITDNWIDRMRSLASRQDVGAVGALLLYPDKRVQHAGVIMGFNESADHAFKFVDAYLNDKGRRNLGYNCSLSSVRDYSAVTAACLMMRKSVFDQLGGFEPRFGVGFNDTDLCLRVREANLKVLYDGATVLFHYESATRSQTKQVMHPEDTDYLLQRHAAILKNGDPFYNPNLSYVTQDHVLREDDGCKYFSVRVTEKPVSEITSPVTASPKPARKQKRQPPIAIPA
ncbi:Glycosyltransferase [Granulibacter bethesdensis]|uniref:Glycosyltransferase n=1 Tax=Granulibacter bethesdensis TaxID=364410 RepID=A0AAN0RG30_9PROT|nr:glycosyltransferase family 2 protein [Granulibacter bethesdensis]AHJ64306.1 Glycosyltransferase [Granulibacter bethesdensis]